MGRGGPQVDNRLMLTATDKPSVDWVRYLSGFAVLGLAVVAFFGLAGGLVSQVVLFGAYEGWVEAELYRPLILPSLVALVAAVAAGVAWRGRRWSRVAVLLAVTVAALLVGAVAMGPTERELERGWSLKLSSLTLPPELTPSAGPTSPGKYEVVRQWTTAQEPQAVCGPVQQALSAWLDGAPVERADGDGCFLSATRGGDSVDVYFHPGFEPGVLVVKLSYAL